MLLIWLALMPVRPAMAAALCLPLTDLALGLIAAHKAKTPITSSGLKRTVAKILMYQVAIILAFAVEVNLMGDLVPTVKIVTGLIGATELKSCLEHLEELSGMPLFESILSRLSPPPIDTILPPNDDKQDPQ